MSVFCTRAIFFGLRLLRPSDPEDDKQFRDHVEITSIWTMNDFLSMLPQMIYE